MLTYDNVIAKLLADAGIEYIFGMPARRRLSSIKQALASGEAWIIDAQIDPDGYQT